jgi:uncharacterized protein YegJ (DUF2314 family)
MDLNRTLLQFLARRLRRVMKGVGKSDPLLVSVSSRDADVNDAVARARATLATFWASFAVRQPLETRHSLKIRVENEANGGEYIWVADVKTLGDARYSGRFANTPMYLRGKRIGDVIEFAEADISDWMFMRNGRIVGGETIRLLLKSLPKVDADALRSRLEAR